MAIAALRRLSGTIHKSRYDRFQNGMKKDAIAAQDNVKLRSVEESIRMVELFRISCSPNELEIRTIETLLNLADMDQEALVRAMKATRNIYNANGKKIGSEPDYQVQLEASKEYTRRMEAVIGKKQSGTSVSVQTNVGVLGPSVITYEDKLREIQSRRGLANVEATERALPSGSDAIDDAFKEEGSLPG